MTRYLENAYGIMIITFLIGIIIVFVSLFVSLIFGAFIGTVVTYVGLGFFVAGFLMMLIAIIGLMMEG